MKTELLAPAGDERSARAALFSGADAIYLGLERFSARDRAENFGLDGLSRTAETAHLLGAKVYVCLNTLVKDSETEDFFGSARAAWNAGADAILVQDMFLGKRLKEVYPEMELHLSTQAGCCNVRGALLAKACGFSRVVLARETPVSDIAAIAKHIETEVFVQGALCTCFSGQCYLSSFAGNNSGNRGKCKQPCRKLYSIDRKGYEEFAYALSPSDLKVGARIRELMEAGVVSFKIEGRLRRPEYVSSAVRYYRALLSGESGESELADLKRAYNRGDYTEGLAFGQKKDFLSRSVQGHIGERVGFLKEGAFCVSAYPARKGDGFKILRGGKEVGGAAFLRMGEGGFYLASQERLRMGDEVRLTTDSALAERTAGERRRTLDLSVTLRAGEPARVTCGQLTVRGPVAERARSAPLTAEEVMACFRKTDGLPLDVKFSGVDVGDAFLPKSALNAFRRTFYEKFRAAFRRAPLPVRAWERAEEEEQPCGETAVLARSFKGLKADILILKPDDYRAVGEETVHEGEGLKFLYLPPFLTAADEAVILPLLPRFDGIYCDGYYGLSLAAEYGLSFFAGTGFNLTNKIAVRAVRAAGARYALSKELDSSEQAALSRGGFVFTEGGIKVMDLCYCPFEKNCFSCDRRAGYTLTDEAGRKFPLRRYRISECRFELYNCAPLAAESAAGRLIDLTAVPSAPATRGHSERSML